MFQQANVYTTVTNVSANITALAFGPCQLYPTGRTICIYQRLTASFCQLSLKAEHQDTFSYRAPLLIIAGFVCFHGVNIDTLHTNRAGLAEEEEEANTFAVLQQAEKAAVNGSSPATEMLASGFPACSKTQVKEEASAGLKCRLQRLRDVFTVSCPERNYSSDTEMQLCKCFAYAGQTGSNYESHCLNWNWWEQRQEMAN